MTELHIGIVGHHSRLGAVRELARTVGADEVSIDQGDPVDPADGCARATENHLVVLEALWKCSTTGWVVVLEDDAQPIDPLRQVLAHALRHAPSRLVGLYLGTGNPSGPVQRAIQPAYLRAQSQNRCWLTADFFVSSVGYAVHRSALADLIVTARNTTGEIALRITRWSQGVEEQTSYTQPSLVNHEDRDSVVYPRPPEQLARLPRRAWSWGARTDWSDGHIPVEAHCPPWSVYDGCNACRRAWELHDWPVPATGN